MPTVCQLPEVSKGRSCALSGFSWAYDATLSRCVPVNTKNCPYATKNRFHSHDSCQKRCPETSSGRILYLLPSEKAIEDYVDKNPGFLSSEIGKRRFRLCHTVNFMVEKGQKDLGIRSLCGEKLPLRRQSKGFLWKGRPLLSVEKGQNVFLHIDRVLLGPNEED